MLPERFVFSEDLPQKTAPASGNNKAICFVCLSGLRGPRQLRNTGSPGAPPFHVSQKLILGTTSSRCSISVCLCTPGRFIVPHFLELTEPLLGTSEGNGVALGHLFGDTAHKGALARGLDASHRPIIPR